MDCSPAQLGPLSMGFFKQAYWSGLPFPPLGFLPDPGIEPKSHESPALQVDSLPPSHQGSPIALRANALKTVCPTLELVVRSVTVKVQRGRGQLWMVF